MSLYLTISQSLCVLHASIPWLHVYHGTCTACFNLHGVALVRACRASLLCTIVLGAAAHVGSAWVSAIGSEIMFGTFAGRPSLILTVDRPPILKSCVEKEKTQVYIWTSMFVKAPVLQSLKRPVNFDVVVWTPLSRNETFQALTRVGFHNICRCLFLYFMKFESQVRCS